MQTQVLAFELDDIELGEHSLMRLGNVIVPNSSYGEIIEAVVEVNVCSDRLEGQFVHIILEIL